MVAEQTEKTIYKTVDKTQKIKTPLEDKWTIFCGEIYT